MHRWLQWTASHTLAALCMPHSLIYDPEFRKLTPVSQTTTSYTLQWTKALQRPATWTPDINFWILSICNTIYAQGAWSDVHSKMRGKRVFVRCLSVCIIGEQLTEFRVIVMESVRKELSAEFNFDSYLCSTARRSGIGYCKECVTQ
jgi:hypothetical protein